MAITDRGFGLEMIERQVNLVLFTQLNDEITEQEELWYDEDKYYASAFGNDVSSKTTIEHIDPSNFYAGHRPSLLEANHENFPNIAVMCYTGLPLFGANDQTQNWSVDIDIELMVKSDKNEEEVNRRIHRTTEAVNAVMVRNDDINGYSMGFNTDPDVTITNIFKQSGEITHGEDWWWAAARIGYNINRYSKLPLGA